MERLLQLNPPLAIISTVCTALLGAVICQGTTRVRNNRRRRQHGSISLQFPSTTDIASLDGAAFALSEPYAVLDELTEHSISVFLLGPFKSGKTTIAGVLRDIPDLGDSVVNTRGLQFVKGGQGFIPVDTEGFNQPLVDGNPVLIQEIIFRCVEQAADVGVFVVGKIGLRDLEDVRKIEVLYSRSKRMGALVIVHNLQTIESEEELLAHREQVRKSLQVPLKLQPVSNFLLEEDLDDRILKHSVSSPAGHKAVYHFFVRKGPDAKSKKLLKKIPILNNHAQPKKFSATFQTCINQVLPRFFKFGQYKPDLCWHDNQLRLTWQPVVVDGVDHLDPPSQISPNWVELFSIPRLEHTWYTGQHTVPPENAPTSALILVIAVAGFHLLDLELTGGAHQPGAALRITGEIRPPGGNPTPMTDAVVIPAIVDVRPEAIRQVNETMESDNSGHLIFRFKVTDPNSYSSNLAPFEQK